MKNNKKMFFSVKTKLVVFGLIVLVGGVVATVSVRADISFKQLLANALADRVGDQILDKLGLNEEEISFGAAYSEAQNDMATSTQDLSDHGGISIFDRLRYGDEPATDSNSVTEKFLFKDFTAASSTLFAIQVGESDGATVGARLYIQDIALKFTGVPTTTMQFFVGTSSSQYVNIADKITSVADISADSLCSLMDNVTMTDGGVLDATSTVIWAGSAYAACTQGYGTDFRNVPITPGAWIVGIASTTDALLTEHFPADLLNGQVYIRYRIVK